MPKAISLSMQVTKGRQEREEGLYSGFLCRPEIGGLLFSSMIALWCGAGSDWTAACHRLIF